MAATPTRRPSDPPDASVGAEGCAFATALGTAMARLQIGQFTTDAPAGAGNEKSHSEQRTIEAAMGVS
jgi:hypothetical protein